MHRKGMEHRQGIIKNWFGKEIEMEPLEQDRKDEGIKP